MWKTILVALFAVALFGSRAPAESTQGVAYGSDANMVSDHQQIAGVELWVAGTPSGVFFENFQYIEGSNSSGYVNFTGYRGISFRCYREPILGKVADSWLEGLFGTQITTGGRPAIAHFRMTDPVGAGSKITFCSIEIYLPGDLTTPIFSRLCSASNFLHVLCDGDPGPMTGGSGWSSNGLAYSNNFSGRTTRDEPADAVYRVYSNGIISFAYGCKGIGFVASRLRSFMCTKTGFLGREAEFWMDGYTGPTPKVARTPAVAHVLVNANFSDLIGFDFMFIEFYEPRNLMKPIYQRLIIAPPASNHIMCK
jgi:hypothetical protein